MNRREYLKTQIAGTAILAASGLVHKANAKNLPTPDATQEDILDTDVLVVGGAQLAT